MLLDDTNLIKVLKENKVVVMPTDTIYGMVGRAENQPTVERIYKIRKRSPEKPCIILIGGVDELAKFSVVLSEKQKDALKKYWPGPVSVVLDCSDKKFYYLHRGMKTLVFRIPKQEGLRSLLKETGPLIAPSANPEGLSPSRDTAEARKYFGSDVDLYIDGGLISGKASKIIKLHEDGSETILRD